MRRVVQISAFPVLLGGAVLLVDRSLDAGGPEFLVVGGTVSVVGLVVLVLQRLLPHTPQWRLWREDAAVDLLHMLVSSGGAGALVKGALFGTLLAGQLALADQIGGTLWPTRLPPLVQLGLALLVADFGAYWVHRLSHEWEPLWRLHALHHSSERLYAFSSGRNHPLHTALTYAVQTTPIVLLGGEPHLLALLATFTATNGILQHANIDYRLGGFNLVFATADLHRWHHSAVLEESKTNYGNNLIVWDVVFGTRRLPEGAPVAVGLGPGARFPRTWLGHLASPLTWRGE